jgi:hypothetical protein
VWYYYFCKQPTTKDAEMPSMTKQAKRNAVTRVLARVQRAMSAPAPSQSNAWVAQRRHAAYAGRTV